MEPPEAAPELSNAILVVDDTPASLVAVGAALEQVDCELVAAGSGRDALRMVLERDFALILMDVNMPGMSGLAVAEMIRGRQRNADVPIIFMTAFDRDDDKIAAAYRLGAVDFLFKPLDRDILFAKVSAVLHLRQQTAQVARQAAELRRQERATAEAALAEERRRLEQQVLQARLDEQRVRTEMLARSNAELDQARRELERSNQRMAEADHRKDEFIAMLSHELRNPLSSVFTGLELFEGVASRDPELAPVHAAMRRQLDHLTSLVDDLLDVGRISSGNFELKPEDVSLHTIVERALEVTQHRLQARGHSLEVDLGDTPLWVHADQVRIAQVLSNVLSNAARFTPADGTIRLVADAVDDSVRIRVIDTGAGMSSEVQARAFEMFFQYPRTTADGGLGVGLPLARRFMDLHGGDIRAESRGTGTGCTVELRLPRIEAPAWEAPEETAPAPAQPGPGSRGPIRIVVIEDNDDIRELTIELLRRWGHEVRSATTAGAGIEEILREHTDLALIDLGLPDMDGHEVARQVRQRLGDARPRLIAVSGFSQAEDRARSDEAGFDEHLAKPVPVTDFLRVIESVSTPSN